MYKYYLVGEMRDADFLPVSGRVSVRVYGSKPFVPSAGCRICGEAVYSRPLDGKEISRCHLMQAPGLIV